MAPGLWLDGEWQERKGPFSIGRSSAFPRLHYFIFSLTKKIINGTRRNNFHKIELLAVHWFSPFCSRIGKGSHSMRLSAYAGQNLIRSFIYSPLKIESRPAICTSWQPVLSPPWIQIHPILIQRSTYSIWSLDENSGIGIEHGPT
jgi:hypothetical protein